MTQYKLTVLVIIRTTNDWDPVARSDHLERVGIAHGLRIGLGQIKRMKVEPDLADGLPLLHQAVVELDGHGASASGFRIGLVHLPVGVVEHGGASA